MEKEQLREIIKKSVEDMWYNRRSINPVEEQTELLTEALHQVLSMSGVSVSLLQSLHQDLKVFQEMGFLTPDARMGLGIAIQQVERYMSVGLDARQQ